MRAVIMVWAVWGLALAGRAPAQGAPAPATPDDRAPVSQLGHAVLAQAELVVQADVEGLRRLAAAQVITLHVTRCFVGRLDGRRLLVVSPDAEYVRPDEQELLLALRRGSPDGPWEPLGKTTLSDEWREAKLRAFAAYLDVEQSAGSFAHRRARLFALIERSLAARDAWTVWNAAGEAYWYCRRHGATLTLDQVETLFERGGALAAQKPRAYVFGGLRAAYAERLRAEGFAALVRPDAPDRARHARGFARAARRFPELFTADDRRALAAIHRREADPAVRTALGEALAACRSADREPAGAR